MTAALLNEEVRRVKELDPDLFLGQLCWYTIHDQRSKDRDMVVSHRDIIDGLTQVGLDTRGAPAAPKGHDVFRRVTNEAQRRKIPTDQEGVYQSILLRDVSEAGEETIVRRLVVETRDARGRELSYHQLVDLIYLRDKQKVDYEYRSDYEQDPLLADRMVLMIKSSFRDRVDKVTSWTVREFVRKLLYDRRATCVRAGGAVFFMRQEFADELSAIEDFVNALPDGLGEFHSLPLIDDQKQRDMLLRAYEDETTKEIRNSMIEIEALRKEGKKITSTKYSTMLIRYRDLKAKTKEYSGLLQMEMERSDAALDLYEKQMHYVLEHDVKDGDA